ncbi:MAG TPA: DUF2142 domain-containing protein [Candidatus Cottocaccamicrobium excrementipullorum]|nr:DUF2142 domain-containing protein [Candidatus Cottocaccamicrobium excrementipullorum]
MKNNAPMLKASGSSPKAAVKPVETKRKQPKGTEPPGAAARRLKYVLAVVLVLVVGIGLEYFWNLPVLHSARRGTTQISLDQAAAEGFVLEPEGFLLTEDKGTISIGLGGAYVDRFVYTFNYDQLLNTEIYVCYYNPYGEADPDQDLIFQDRNPKLADASSIHIGKRVDSIVLSVDRSNLGEPGTREEAAEIPVVITGFQIQNQPVMNWYRVGFFWVLLGLSAFFWLFRGYLGRHVEAGFLAVCLAVGTLTICALPANKVGYDEETHLYRAMGLASFPHGMNINQTVFSLMVPNLDSWPENQPGSAMEQKQLRDYLNENGDYKTGDIHLEPEVPAGTVPAYFGQALVLKLCKGLGVAWGTMLTLGRFGNLIGYGLLMYFAIRKLPAGKVIMTVIGLMPTPMFLACTYSYDPWVTGWISLGAACMIREILTPEKKITWKSWGFILLCFFLGCSPKAVYAPLILTGFLIPAKKFQNRRQKIVMRAGFLLLFAGLMSSFVLPVLIAPKETGDIRGGETSEAGQMSYVLGHFGGYLKILFANLIPAMPKMLFGRDIFSVQGHLADSPFTWLAMGLAGYAVVTDTRSSVGRGLKLGQKIWIFLMAGGCALLIWTSMYIAYTEPGRVVIAGVQGRYYLPILFLVYLTLNSRLIIARTKNIWYHTGVLAISTVLLLATLWQTVIAPMCM